MDLVIIKYSGGNTKSVVNALRRLGIEPIVSDQEAQIRAASHIIFPGVGEASSAMEYLQLHHLDLLLKTITQPILGICLGMQLMCDSSEENHTDCLSIFPSAVRLFRGVQKVPHMGWSKIYDLESPLFAGVPDGSYLYFVHSYRADLSDHTIARCVYGEKFSAAIGRGNYYGVQFHPEKSGTVGEKILKNFLELK